ncbi:MAG: hypothetical protein JNJ91_06100 [Flavobacteriales bacterium]|nr:hypothetical protein [Flavobacteriales bacterium]
MTTTEDTADQVPKQPPSGRGSVLEQMAKLKPLRLWQGLYMGLGLLGIAAWVAVFTVGSSMDSAPYRIAMRNYYECGTLEFDPPRAFVETLTRSEALAAILFYWTPTNVGLLCVLAAFVGGCTSYNFRFEGMWIRLLNAFAQGEGKIPERMIRRYSFMYELPWVSLSRGFFVYLVLIATWGFFEGHLFSDVTTEGSDIREEAYKRMACVLSGIGFIVGFDPTRFEELIDRVTGFVDPNKG